MLENDLPDLAAVHEHAAFARGEMKGAFAFDKVNLGVMPGDGLATWESDGRVEGRADRHVTSAADIRLAAMRAAQMQELEVQRLALRINCVLSPEADQIYDAIRMPREWASAYCGTRDACLQPLFTAHDAAEPPMTA